MGRCNAGVWRAPRRGGKAADCPARTFCLLEARSMPPAPRHSTHKAPVLAPLMERCPDVAWGGRWQGHICPPRPLCLIWVLCASYGWWQMGSDHPTPWSPACACTWKATKNPTHLISSPQGQRPQIPLPITTHGSLVTLSSPLAGCRLPCPRRGACLRQGCAGVPAGRCWGRPPCHGQSQFRLLELLLLHF